MNISVSALLNSNVDSNYNDKIFWYASTVDIEQEHIKVYIQNDNLVTFDNIALNIKKISELRKIKQTGNKLFNVLVSSGSFLFINNKLAVTQRELTTQYDPGYWTTPAGRCDRTILTTGIKETIEEIEIKQNDKILYPDIAKPLIETESNNIVFYETSFESSIISIKTYKVLLFLDNKLIEECKSWVYYSKDVNTLEFRIPIFTKLNEEELTFTNPEFGTNTGLKSIDELKKLKCVPALKQLLEELK